MKSVKKTDEAKQATASAAEVVKKPAKVAKTPKIAKPKTAVAAKTGAEATQPALKNTKAAKVSTPVKAKKKAKKQVEKKVPEGKTAKILDSQVAYQGPLFRVMRDHLIEPDGTESRRDVIRHNGSVVILAVDHDKHKKHKKDPWIVIERQYRHAAGQYLWELPAGKLDAGEDALTGAKRELAEETGYVAKKWTALVEYFASPGFLGESMKVFLAEGLVAGEAHPEEDEHIDFRLVRLSELLEMADKGKIIDGKTLTTVLLYARQLGIKKKD